MELREEEEVPPTVPRTGLTLCPCAVQHIQTDLIQFKPCNYHRYVLCYYSGTYRLNLTTQTPSIIIV